MFALLFFTQLLSPCNHNLHSLSVFVIRIYPHFIFQLLGSTATYIAPLALERILLHIANNGRDDDTVETLIPISITLAVVLLFLGPLLGGLCDGQNYVRGR